MFGRGFGISELFVAAVVAMLLEQPAGFGQGGAVTEEAGAVEMDIGLVKWHRAALGDLPGFVQILPATGFVTGSKSYPGTGQQAKGEVVHMSGCA